MAESERTAVQHDGAIGGTSEGNRVTFFDDGEALFDEKAAAIRGARERVWIETFLFTPDQTGRAALDLAADAARRGCDVILLFDHAGGHVTNLGFYKPVEEAGGRVAIFNPLSLWRRYGRRLGSIFRHRDHRKILVADDVAFCGGHNYSQSYMGPPPHSFYDITVRMEGPCVRDLADVFLDSFRTATGDTRALPPAPPPVPGGVRAHAFALDGTRGIDDLVGAYREALESAREEAILIFAYFLPDETLCAPLIAAAERGVRVTLLSAGKSDVPVVRIGAQHTFDRLLAAGVRIYQLQEPMLHAKALVVDGETCMVGSFDVNKLQRRNTAEVAVVVRDRALASRIHEGFRSCLEQSTEVTIEDRENRSWLARSAEWLAYRAIR